MIEKLSALAVARAVKAGRRGRLGDGGGLFLQIARDGGASWVFRYRNGGSERWLGLGSLEAVSLAAARVKARTLREMRAAGTDPMAERRAERAKTTLEAAKAMTFDDCADRFINAHGVGWRNPKHRDQWRATLKTYASPVFGALPVQTVDVTLVMRALEPIWTTKPETASRLRGRIERVLSWATTTGYRQGENPARWRGHLDQLLPVHSKVRSVKHHAALPYAEIGTFVTALRGRDAIAARALEFTVLTAARTGEAIGAQWDEIDFVERTWTIPAQRMKAKRDHRVPLSEAAVELIERMREVRQDSHVFPSERIGKPLSNMAMLTLLRRMGRGDLTTHGFRATFRTWAADRTAFPREVIEAALAHVVGSKVEAAYQRGDLFEKRRRLMDEWARFCDTPPTVGEVVPLKAGRK
jgi:integrase